MDKHERIIYDVFGTKTTLCLHATATDLVLVVMMLMLVAMMMISHDDDGGDDNLQ